jgi:hypothetical protein
MASMHNIRAIVAAHKVTITSLAKSKRNDFISKETDVPLAEKVELRFHADRNM